MKLETKDPRLVLKTASPKVSRNLLARERLSLHAPGLSGRSVIAVQATSGFGKTSLLAQWRKEVLASGGIVAWLSVDPWDDDNRFVHGLAVAMQVASGRPRFGESFLQSGHQHGGQHTALTCWLAEVVGLGAEVLLVLDDIHLLPQATSTDSLLYLLHNAPVNLKIILSSRKPLTLEVGELLGHGQYACVDVEALRFSLEETISLLRARFGARIDYASCARLHALTEGWPLGLQLAIAQLEKSVNLKETIARDFVRSSDLRRYFVESLVDRLDARESDFLVNVSFLDAIHPDLCQAVTQDAASDAILKHLIEVTPIIGEGVGSEWRRIHPLAREFLNARFESLPDAHQRCLRERAMRWLVERHIYEEATRLALQSDQLDYAYDLAEQCLYEVLQTGQHFKVSALIERMPSQEIAKRPQLKLAVAWALALSERHAEAAQMARPLLDDPAATDSTQLESAEICATAAFFADDLDQMHRLIAPRLSQLPQSSPLLQNVGANYQAIWAVWQAKPDQARAILEQAAMHDERSALDYATGWRHWIAGFSYLWEGQAALAEEYLRTAWTHAEKTSGHHSPMAAMLGVALAAALWDTNHHAQIPQLLAGRQGLMERYIGPDTFIMGYVTTARMAVTQGQERFAFSALDRLFAMGEMRQLQRLCIASLVEQMRLHALQGRQDACSVVAGRLDQLMAVGGTPSDDLRWPQIQIQLALARSHFHAVHHAWKQVLEQVAAALPIARNLRRGKDCIQLQLLKAMALKRCGQDGEALLAEAWGMARMLGLERILPDTHPDLEDWLHKTDKPTASHPPTAPQPLPPRKGSSPVLPQSALLTSKEREVLELLARNMSNKEIALAMAIGSETVKWHMKNLFDKLHAANRKHLLHRAHMLGLLDFAS